jgi:hypothetical protein
MAKSKGRPAGFQMDDSHRTKIANSQILNRLVNHVEGKIEMSSTQVTAGLGLLKKIMPDLAQTDLTSGGKAFDFPDHIKLTAAHDNRDD